MKKSKEIYPKSLIDKYGLLSNGKLNIDLAGLAQLLESKTEKESTK